MNSESSLTAETVRALLQYDDDTGIFTWKAASIRRGVGERAGTNCPTGYRTIGVLSQRHLEHRLAWLWVTGSWPKNEIDHLNGDRSDNRFSNLRPATRLENSRNQKINSVNTSGFKGVRRCNSRWSARITIDLKEIHLGVFDTAQEAHRAYTRAAEEHFGPYARTA